jgi:hypothetical protein
VKKRSGPRSWPIPLDWSQLERATELRYRECLANGGHVASGCTVRRRAGGSRSDYGDWSVCAHCEVPIQPRPSTTHPLAGLFS